MRLLLAPIVSLLALATPALANAQSGAVAQIVGVFNIFVGLMLTAALLLYGIGVIMWWIRLGSWPSYRTEAIRILEWAVAVLFTLVVLLGIVQFFQRHQQAGAYVISFIVIVGIIWIIVYLLKNSGGEEEKKH